MHFLVKIAQTCKSDSPNKEFNALVVLNTKNKELGATCCYVSVKLDLLECIAQAKNYLL